MALLAESADSGGVCRGVPELCTRMRHRIVKRVVEERRAALTGRMPSLWRTGTQPIEGTAFEPGRHHDVIVVGAGLTGLCTAVMLTREGLDVAVVDSGRVAELATGGNTGKATLLQGTRLSTLRRDHPASLVRAYVDANRDGLEWLEAFAAEAGVPCTRRTAVSYAQAPAGAERVEAELAAAREAGLPVRRIPGPDGAGDGSTRHQFPFADGVALDDQLAIDPVVTANALAREFVAAGGALHTGVRVRHTHAVPHAWIDTDAGYASADQIVLATGMPIADRGLSFAKVRALRSYCVAFAYDGELPEGMYISVDEPTRSIRPVNPDDGPAELARLIVGGNGHPVGRGDSEKDCVDDVIAWTRRHFPGAEPVATWSAQDYESHNLVPFVGALPRGLGRIRFATGYAKWGLTNAPAAALRLSAEIRRVPRRERPSWMATLGRRLTVPADLGRGGVENLKIGWEATAGWTGALRTHVPVPAPPEGEGVVASRAGHPVGISTVDGTTRAVSAVCTHLGGVVSWNDAECTWDCPLHGSRFAPDGTRIEGPAVGDLERLPRTGRPSGARADE